MKKSKKIMIWTGSIIAVIVVALVVAYIAMVNTPDGSKDYTGAKLKAAQIALDYDVSAHSPNVMAPFTKPHIEKIVPATKEQWLNGMNCDTRTPEDPGYYSVTIRRVWLFGMTIIERPYTICNLAG